MTQQNTQAVVLQQPTDQKIHLDLQHSTDTTAIWSFVIAMVVAFILGISATIIAIWYGRKSFKLTEMSFKIVVEEIKASQQSAIDLNTKLFEQQRILRAEKEKLDRRKNINDRFRNTSETFVIEVELFLSSMTLLHLRHEQFQFSEKVEVGSYQHEVFIGINKKIDKIFESRSKLLFSALEMEVSTYDAIHEAVHETTMIVIDMNNRLVKDRGNLIVDAERCKKAIYKNKVIFKKIFDKKAA